MSNDLISSAKCFGLYDQDTIIGFCAVLHQPHPKNAKLKRCTRLVILPDYQGIGLGTRFLDSVARMYVAQGYEFSIVTSAKNMIAALNRSSEWIMIRWSVSQNSSSEGHIDYKRKSMRTNCKCASFKYRQTAVNASRFDAKDRDDKECAVKRNSTKRREMLKTSR